MVVGTNVMRLWMFKSSGHCNPLIIGIKCLESHTSTLLERVLVG